MRKEARVFVCTVLLVGISAGQLFGQSKEDAIRHLLDITGSAALGTQIMEGMIEAYSKDLPHVPQEFWTEFRAAIDMEEMIDGVVEIYDRYFTYDEIMLLTEFYTSDIGEKVARLLPEITQESMQMGQALGAVWSDKAIEMLIDRGYLR